MSAKIIDLGIRRLRESLKRVSTDRVFCSSMAAMDVKAQMLMQSAIEAMDEIVTQLVEWHEPPITADERRRCCHSFLDEIFDRMQRERDAHHDHS